MQRRGFLKTILGLGAALCGLPSLLRASPERSIDRLCKSIPGLLHYRVDADYPVLGHDGEQIEMFRVLAKGHKEMLPHVRKLLPTVRSGFRREEQWRVLAESFGARQVIVEAVCADREAIDPISPHAAQSPA